MANLKYKRVLIKLSGESLCDGTGFGVDPQACEKIAAELAPAAKLGVGIGIVIGAGNLMRGRHLADAENIHPTTGDYMGMLGTVMNGLALKDALIHQGADAVVVSAIPMPLICESYHRPFVIEHLDAGKVVIFVGGTSHPGVTTDMCAAIRANDISADVLLKATKVDGVYDKDPHKFADAVKYDEISYEQAVVDRLGVMDLSAMAFCMDHRKPIMVFKMSDPGNLVKAVQGETIGTVVK